VPDLPDLPEDPTARALAPDDVDAVAALLAAAEAVDDTGEHPDADDLAEWWADDPVDLGGDGLAVHAGAAAHEELRSERRLARAGPPVTRVARPPGGPPPVSSSNPRMPVGAWTSLVAGDGVVPGGCIVAATGPPGWVGPSQRQRGLAEGIMSPARTGRSALPGAGPEPGPGARSPPPGRR
jgi:hypothetical protein